MHMTGWAPSNRSLWRGGAAKAHSEMGEERPAIAEYTYLAPKPFDKETGYSVPNLSYAYVAQAVELEVDLETGFIKILRVVSANDVGQAINPALVEGQIEGAVVQAEGYTLIENFITRNGHILTDQLSTYLIPTILDIPEAVELVILEVSEPNGPFGARGLGELPFLPLAPAIAAAVHDATGVWFNDFPLTPNASCAAWVEFSMRLILSRHKYKLIIFVLLLAASIVSILLTKARVAYSHSNDYRTLIFNLRLAWIPFIFATLAYVVSWSRKLLYLVVPVCAFIWLIFFPNAPYILTDFQHLSSTANNAPVWFDVLMLLWCAWTGLLLGLVSLHFMQEVVSRAFGAATGWYFAILVTVLSSLGIVLGQFYRWNSWDIFGDPTLIAHDMWSWLKHPFANMRVYSFALLFSLLFLFVYLAMHAFGKIMQENQLQDKQDADERGKSGFIDYHMHSCFSEDADDSLEAMCRRAIDLGIPEIGFSEHWDVGPFERNPRFFRPEPWYAELERLRDLFAGQLAIRAGIEIDEPHIFPMETLEVLQRAPFDYVIGSVHFVGENFMFNKNYFQEHTADEVYGSYFSELERMVRTADIDIVAHFDIPSRTGIPIFGYEPVRYEKIIRSALKTCIERSLALDVNAGGLRKPAHNLMPDPLIMKWYVEMGGKRFTLGSDAHRIPEVGLHLEKAVENIRAVGINQIMQFKQRQAEFIAL